MLPANFNNKTNKKNRKTNDTPCSATTKAGNECKKMCIIGENMCAQHIKITNSPTQTKVNRKTTNTPCDHTIGNGDNARQCKNKALIDNTKCHNHK